MTSFIDTSRTIDKGPSLSFREGVESLSRGDSQKALQQFRNIYRTSRKSGEQNKMAWALVHMAMVLRGQREYENTIQYLEDARVLFTSNGNDLGLATIFQELSFAHRELDRKALALEYGHQATKIFEEKGKSLDLAWAYENLAVIHFNLYHRHESLTFAKRARSLFLEMNSQMGLAWNACNLANLYMEMGFHNRSERYFSEAIKIFSTLQNSQGLGWSQLGLGICFRAQGRYDSAQVYIEKAKNIFKEIGLKDRLAWCLVNEAAVKRIVGQEEDAMLLNKRALQLFGPLRNSEGVAWALFQVGQLQRDHGHYVKAWQTFRESLNLFTDIANRKGSGWAENELGETYLELNDQTHARECFIKAKVIAEQLDEPALKVEVDKNVARLNISEGYLQRALSTLDQSEILSRKIQAHETEAEILLQKARYFVVIGDLGRARQTLRQLNSLIESRHLTSFRPSLGVALGEVLAGEGKIESAVKVWHDVIQLSRRIQHRRQRLTALMGIIQVLSYENVTKQIPVMLNQLEKEIRVLGSRELKAKLMAVRALSDYRQNGDLDTKAFQLSFRIVEAAGLTVLERQLLSLQTELFKAEGKHREQQEGEEKIRGLLEKGSIDLHLVIPRHVSFESAPVSLIS